MTLIDVSWFSISGPITECWIYCFEIRDIYRVVTRSSHQLFSRYYMIVPCSLTLIISLYHIFSFYVALRNKEKVESKPYRIKAKDGTFVRIKSKVFSFQNPWTKEVEYLAATNTVLPWVHNFKTPTFQLIKLICSSNNWKKNSTLFVEMN